MTLASIVIPAYGRTELLRRVLRLLDDQTHDAYEILVVSDGCPDASRTVAEIDLAHACRLYETEVAGFGAAAARNVGARFARGELLIFLDADCLVGRDHVERFVASHAPETLLLGPIEYVDAEDWTKWITGDIRPPFTSVEPPAGIDHRAWLAAYCWTGNLAVDRRAFLELGGFDLGFVGQGGEDVDFGLRFASCFGRIERVKAPVRHVGPTAAFAHLRGEAGPLDVGRIQEQLRRGRHAGGRASLVCNGGAAWFADEASWRGHRELRRREPVAPPLPEPEGAAADPWTGTEILQQQLEKSASALVTLARRLDRQRPLGGAEGEFLALYARMVRFDPAHFSRVWSDPQGYAWIRRCHRLVESLSTANPAGEQTSSVLAAHFEGFKPFVLACAHVAGESLVLDRPFLCPERLSLPGTPWCLEEAGGVEIHGIGSGRSGIPELRISGQGARLVACPVVAWRGQEIRLQPHPFLAAGGRLAELVHDGGHAFQRDHREMLHAALDPVERFSEGAAEMSDWLQVIAFNRPASGYSNTSSSELPGALLLQSVRNLEVLSETLVHELHHQRLFALEAEGPFFETTAANAGLDFVHYSPWREDARPLKGLFHGFYVYVAVTRYWLARVEADGLEPGMRPFADERLARLSLQLARAARSLEGAPFSAAGRALFERLCSDTGRLRSRIEALGIDGTAPALTAVPEGGFAREASWLDGRPLSVSEAVAEHAARFDDGEAAARRRQTLSFGAREPLDPSAPDAPKISCLCVTRDRLALLDRAVRCFLAQTHPHRELVIVYEDEDHGTARYVERTLAHRPDVVLVRTLRAEGKSLGELRNRAVAAATGEYVCQWDDDDWYHPDRLTVQWRALADAPDGVACVLGRWTFFDAAAGRAYLAPWRAWEGSLLCRRDRMPSYPDLRRGEDTPVLEALLARPGVIQIDRPELYVYVHHGGNTFDTGHFEGFLGDRHWLGARVSAEVAERLAKGA